MNRDNRLTAVTLLVLLATVAGAAEVKEKDKEEGFVKLFPQGRCSRGLAGAKLERHRQTG